MPSLFKRLNLRDKTKVNSLEFSDLLLIFGASLALSLTYFLLIHPNPLLHTDAVTYVKNAERFLQTHEFAEYWALNYRAWRPHGYSFLIATLYTLFGPTNTPLLLLQVVLQAAGVCFLALSAAQLVRSSKAGYLVAFLSLFYAPSYLYTFLFLPEMVIFFLMSLVLFLMVKVQERFTSNRPILSQVFLIGFVLGVSCYFKNNIFYFPFFLAPLLFAASVIKRSKQLALCSAVGIAAFFLTVSPYLVRNYFVIGSGSRITTYGGYNLLLGNIGLMHGDWINTTGSIWYAEHDKITESVKNLYPEEVNQDDELKRLGVIALKKDPKLSVLKLMRTCYEFFAHSGSYGELAFFPYSSHQYFLMEVAGILGFIILFFGYRKSLFVLSSALYISYYFSLVSLSFVMNRYKEPLAGIWLISSGIAIYHVVKAISSTVPILCSFFYTRGKGFK